MGHIGGIEMPFVADGPCLTPGAVKQNSSFNVWMTMTYDSDAIPPSLRVGLWGAGVCRAAGTGNVDVVAAAAFPAKHR